MGELTALKVKNETTPGRHPDGAGLYLNIKPSGAKSWVQRIVVDGKRRDMGLGGYPSVSLADARKLAAANKSGATERGKARRVKEVKIRKSTSPTFRDAADSFFALKSTTWKSEKVKRNWQQRAERYVFPMIGALPVEAISRVDVLAVLEPIWTAKPETGRKVREILRDVLDWAVDHEYIDVNPENQIRKTSLPPMPKVKEHFKALPYCKVSEAVAAVYDSTAFPSTKLAFEFLVLTASRPGEVRFASWDEIDLDAATWTVPAGRMKANKEHRVPLSAQAVDVLTRAKAVRSAGPYIFPNDLRPDKPLSENAFTVLLKRLNLPATAHGFRSSFRDWCADNGVDRELAEASLAHSNGNAVEASYWRSDVLDRRRAVMNQWGAFLVS